MLESIDRLVCVRLDGTYNIDRPSGAVASSKQIHMNEDTASTPERCAFLLPFIWKKLLMAGSAGIPEYQGKRDIPQMAYFVS
jgi:hypothetical protein